MLAKEVFETFPEQEKEELQKWMIQLLELLYKHQSKLMEDIYDNVGNTHDVKIFVRYNANKALMNLGFDPHFEEEEVNPVVLNGLNTTTKEMDFFSMKGNGYQSMISESLSEDDFAELDMVENLALPTQKTVEQVSIFSLSEQEIIEHLVNAVEQADIYSASRAKEVETTLLDYSVKLMKRYYGERLTAQKLIEFITQDDELENDDEQLEFLIGMFNREEQDSELNAENIKMVKWLIDYFGIEENYDFVNDEDDTISSEYEQTSSYRRLLVNILKDL